MVTSTDLFLIPVAYLYIFSLIAFVSYWKGKKKISGQLARKIVHLGIGNLVILAPILFSSYIIPTLIGVSFIVITYLTSPISPFEKWRLSAFKDGHNFGTVYYAISLTLLLLLFFDRGWIIQVGFLPLVYGDALANIFGVRYGSHKWFRGSKSVEGSMAGLIGSYIIIILSLLVYLVLNLFPGDFVDILVLAGLSSTLMMWVELVSPRGLDNLTIPMSCTTVAILFDSLFIQEVCNTLLCF